MLISLIRFEKKEILGVDKNIVREIMVDDKNNLLYCLDYNEDNYNDNMHIYAMDSECFDEVINDTYDKEFKLVYHNNDELALRGYDFVLELLKKKETKYYIVNYQTILHNSFRIKAVNQYEAVEKIEELISQGTINVIANAEFESDEQLWAEELEGVEEDE